MVSFTPKNNCNEREALKKPFFRAHSIYLSAALFALAGWALTSIIVKLLFAENVDDMSLSGQFWLALLPLQGAFLSALAVIFQQTSSGKFLVYLNLRPLPPAFFKIVKLSILGAILFYPISIVLNQLTILLFKLAGKTPRSPPISRFLSDITSLPVLISLITAAVIIAPVIEEILFRLVIFESLRPVGYFSAAVLTSAIFTILHGAPVQFPALFMLAMFLQYLRRRFKTLWAPVFVHAAFNTITLIFVRFLISH